MWCKNCRQDIPGVLSQNDKQFCCMRCGQLLGVDGEYRSGTAAIAPSSLSALLTIRLRPVPGRITIPGRSTKSCGTPSACCSSAAGPVRGSTRRSASSPGMSSTPSYWNAPVPTATATAPDRRRRRVAADRRGYQRPELRASCWLPGAGWASVAISGTWACRSWWSGRWRCSWGCWFISCADGPAIRRPRKLRSRRFSIISPASSSIALIRPRCTALEPLTAATRRRPGCRSAGHVLSRLRHAAQAATAGENGLQRNRPRNAWQKRRASAVGFAQHVYWRACPPGSHPAQKLGAPPPCTAHASAHC